MMNSENTAGRIRHRRPLLAAIGVVAGLSAVSCSSVGQDELVSSHSGYNDAVQLTVAREVLSNIVRTRYSDPMQFLSVSSINASFSVDAGASGNVGGIGAGGAVGALGGSIGYSASPTISFVPQSEAGFYRSLQSPLEVAEAIGFALLYRFAVGDSRRQRLSLRMGFASINGADDFTTGHVGDLYVQRIDAIVRLLELGARFRQLPEWDFDSSALPKSLVRAEDQVEAFKNGLYFVEEDDGESVRLARYRLVLALILPSADDPEVTAALEVLGVRPGKGHCVLRPPLHATPGSSDPYALWVGPRSMLDIFSMAARCVQIPDAHASIAPQLDDWMGGGGEMVIPHIRCSEDMPPYPYRVEHRGHWFYIDDTEIDSRMFLESMVGTYSSRLGSKQAGDTAPQLVLPVGG